MKKIRRRKPSVIETREITMPCGKHIGKKISKLPSNYLKYVAENWHERSDLDKLIIKEADDEYQFRKLHNLL